MARTTSETHPVSRIVGCILGVFAILMAGVWGTNAGDDLALSVGAYGNSGTYTVSGCHDTDLRSNKSDYKCTGMFLPHGGQGSSYAEIDGAAEDYPDGARVEMQKEPGGEPQPTGFWPALGEIWQVGLALMVVGIGIALLVDPKKSPHARPETTPREKVSQGFSVVGVAGLAIAVLDGVVAIVAGLISLAA
ncbi:hypothetical protein J7I98_34055 [Streptomyces sp. ISL-98]|uniref:hypothetical protein n=1 Tax=Streptomyces sp. ISL-98 TaxID=2819192 RepID=UPI001BE68C78|nr:hypothetical protein [Streptomyces sp. ISL-98]MBT2510760.1 hypothetical protein [Streptomyces sp. ISL-98]